MSRYIEISMAKAVFDEGDKSLFDIAPSIDIVRCKECKYRERCEQIVVFDIGENQVKGRKIDFCSYGCREERQWLKDT